MKKMYLVLMLALGVQFAQAIDKEELDSGIASPMLVEDHDRLERVYQKLCTLEGCNEFYNGESLMEVLAYKLKTTRQTLENTETFEQFIVDHVRSLPGNHSLLKGVNVHGNASWFPSDPFHHNAFMVSFPSLTDVQRDHICNILNTTYEPMALVTRNIYRGGGIVGFNQNVGMICRKDLFLKHVFGASKG